MGYLGLAALLMVALTACSNRVAELPEDRFYRLPEPTPVAAAPRFAGTLAVALPASDGLHNERAMLYAQHDRLLEIRRYHYFFWVQTPPRLVQEHLAEYLRRARVAEPVVLADGKVGSGLRLESRLIRFERIVGGTVPQVMVELELALRDGADARRHRYRVLLPAQDGSVYASVEAFGQALEAIYARFLQEPGAG